MALSPTEGAAKGGEELSDLKAQMQALDVSINASALLSRRAEIQSLVLRNPTFDFRIDKEPVAHICLGSPFNPAVKEPRQWQPITTGGVNKPEPIANLGAQVASHETAGLDLIAAIRNNRAPLIDAKQGRETIEMVSAIFESHRLNGQRVTFPLKTRVNPLTLL